ncbi:D-alanyl-D-alanine carboxypeptidase family protein [Caldanaerobius polysaccharolyticus]|uniref:D-alanyl-D-alanine carboxypeptidase family protein n=1 Tax=Caldanaerobius polysaccharolyticus TaxID=44256 RepID=UPI00047C5367|nr:D-alanyl-D-alanine carboxypeptidase family protein [Caldanaerobius polysaccharolyticus]
MKFRKIVFTIALVGMLFFNLLQPAFAQQDVPDFKLTSKAAVLMDAASGKVLYEYNAHKRLPPASITKIMSMLLFMEAIDSGRIKVTDMVTASERASSMGGSQVYLAPGEEMSVDDLMKAIAIASGNDATVALAEYIAGTEEMFVKMMNKKAKELGLKDTHFVNSTGLPAKDHYTSAYDVAVISRELITKHPGVLKWTKIYLDTLRKGEFGLANTNKLVRFYRGADGIKTGSTNEAGFCLAATALRDGMRLISVVFGAPDSKRRFDEASRLLDYGFASYKSYQVAGKGQVIRRLKVEKGLASEIQAVASDDLSVLIRKGEDESIKKKIVLPQKVVAPVKKGQKLGEIIVYKSGVEVSRLPIIAGQSVKKAGVVDYYIRILNKWL